MTKANFNRGQTLENMFCSLSLQQLSMRRKLLKKCRDDFFFFPLPLFRFRFRLELFFTLSSLKRPTTFFHSNKPKGAKKVLGQSGFSFRTTTRFFCPRLVAEREIRDLLQFFFCVFSVPLFESRVSQVESFLISMVG